KRLEYNWLPEAIQRASDIINGNLDSHFKYGAGEIIGINKSNPNGYMRFNTDGIGFSRDGGKTYRTAITYEGIVADYIASGTLDANLVRVLGGNETTYTFIDGDYIESRGQYYRTWFGETTFADLKFQLGRGYFRVNNEAENKRLYFSDKGISTFIQGYADENPDQENSGSGVIEFFSHQYNGPQWNTGNIRGLTLFSNQGHVAIKTANRDIILDADRDVKILASRGTVTLQPRDGNRDGLNHFRFNVKDNDSAGLSDGWIQYGSPAANYGSGLRFKKSTSGRPIIYATNGNGDINSGNFQADSFIGSLEAQSDNAYALVNDRLRITSKAGYNGGNINYRDLQAAEGMFRSLKLNTDMSGSNFYIGVSGGELRVTSNLLGAGGNYRPIRVGEVILDGGGRLVHEDGSTFIQGNVDVRATRVRSGTLVPMVAREFNSSSSEELKANIKPYEGNGLDVVCGLNIVNFDWIESPEAGRQIGVIAENSPDISSSSGKEIKINDLVMYLTKSVQELHEENNKLRGEIEHGKQSHKFNRQFFGRSSSRQSPTNRRIRNSCSRAAS
ncbi:tail fiber domain-containing protein, partial [Oceanobacillus neutriphilus]|uniref:tail fiber domain-containing protein n=1 Tax=Oceanobacillus neutriphilus TaxID=531815 RepID=UPI001664F99A